MQLKEKKSLFPAKSKLHSKIEELQECNDKLRSERKKMKHKLEETMSELKNVRQLNERLQTALIDKTNECESKKLCIYYDSFFLSVYKPLKFLKYNKCTNK